MITSIRPVLFVLISFLFGCSHLQKVGPQNTPRFQIDAFPEFHNKNLGLYISQLSLKICDIYRRKCPQVIVADTNDVHIPLNEYKFSEFWKIDAEK